MSKETTTEFMQMVSEPGHDEYGLKLPEAFPEVYARRSHARCLGRGYLTVISGEGRKGQAPRSRERPDDEVSRLDGRRVVRHLKDRERAACSCARNAYLRARRPYEPRMRVVVTNDPPPATTEVNQ